MGLIYLTLLEAFFLHVETAFGHLPPLPFFNPFPVLFLML